MVNSPESGSTTYKTDAAGAIRTAALCFSLLVLLAGCTSSIRYTRGQASGGDVDEGQRSGWEESSVVGGTDARPAGWLASALSEPDRGQPRRQSTSGGADASRRLELAVASYLGVPYRYGGTTRRGFDCSGFVSAVYREVYGVPLKRTSSAMWREGVPVKLGEAKPGDLVFFKGGTFGTIDHVGIYMGKTRFVHSSTSSGVIYSNLKETYYARRFAGVRRML